MVHSLHKGREFSSVYDAGNSRANRYLVMYVNGNGLSENRIGIVASKKIGNSVVRHRVRRLIRESLRLNGEKFGIGLDIIVIARRTCVGRTQAEITEAVLHVAGLLGITV
ncbi:MAG: ribonuclease P protein component [Lachnospiraceae bacterium]|nr:ribonuclease P protein component [Lachnospiraceae bacterium]